MKSVIQLNTAVTLSLAYAGPPSKKMLAPVKIYLPPSLTPLLGKPRNGLIRACLLKQLLPVADHVCFVGEDG